MLYYISKIVVETFLLCALNKCNDFCVSFALLCETATLIPLVLGNFSQVLVAGRCAISISVSDIEGTKQAPEGLEVAW